MSVRQYDNLLKKKTLTSAISSSLSNSKTNRTYRQELEAEQKFVDELQKQVEKNGTNTI